GGRLALDFVNTVGGRGSGGAAIRDKLGSYGDLLGWSVLAGTLDRGAARALGRRAVLHARQAAGVLKRAVRLREALYRIFTCASADTGVLHAEVAIGRAE